MPGLAERYAAGRAAISTAGAGDLTITATLPGRRVIVLGFTLVNGVATAQTITWKSGASTNLTGAMSLPSSIGGALSVVDSDAGLFETARGEPLVLSLSAATVVTGFVNYVVPQA